MKAKRPRITDVAKRAGVSESAVSVVLNNRVGQQVRVSEDTQRKIWEAVRELGYIANPVAQTLAGGRTGIAAVFTFEAIFPIDSRSFYYPFLIGVEEEADRHNYDLLLVTGGGSAGSKRRIFHQGINRLQRADGAILLGHGDQEEVQGLLDENYPFVFVGKRNIRGLSYVAADYETASAGLVEYLIQNGHQRIAFLRSTRQTESSQDREAGVIAALQKHQLPALMQALHPYQVTEAVIRDYIEDGCTAFIAEDDELARQVLKVGNLLRLQCPQDFSLCVLGNPLNPLSDVPNWTTFNIPRRQMGIEAFKLLLKLLAPSAQATASPLRITLPCTFHAGETVMRR